MKYIFIILGMLIGLNGVSEANDWEKYHGLVNKLSPKELENLLNITYIGKSDAPKLINGEIAFRDFYWIDNYDNIREKLKDTGEYSDLLGIASRNSLEFNRSLIKNDRRLNDLYRELLQCNVGVLSEEYQAESYSTKNTNYFTNSIRFFFSPFEKKPLLYYWISFKRDKINGIVSALNEKYGEGEKIQNNWIRWTNRNAVLFFNATDCEAFYINYDNLKLLLPQCQQAGKKVKDEIKTDAKKLFQ